MILLILLIKCSKIYIKNDKFKTKDKGCKFNNSANLMFNERL